LEVEVLVDTPLYLLPTLQASLTASTNNYNTLNDLRQTHPFAVVPPKDGFAL
jgi:hypothetical protein